MKIHQLNYKALLSIALAIFSISLNGQVYESSRSVREAYKISSGAEVQVVNKYGDIHLIPWEKDSVVFEVDFSVTSNKQSKVDKIVDYIDFDFKATAYYVIAQTVFKGQNSIWSEMADVANTIFSSGTTTRINYTVFFPAKNNVKIENKFGNIYTTDHTGKLEVKLSNGDFKAHSLTGATRLDLEFGNANIEKINSAAISLGYAELTLAQSNDISLESRSSKIYLTTCDMLNLNSKRDKYYIKSVGELTGETFFSYISLDKVLAKINIKTNYGDFKILDIGPVLSRMDFNSACTDITFFLNDQHFYDFEFTRDDKSSILSSATVISKKEEPVPGIDKTYKSSITAGKSGKPKVSVSINIKSGKIFLMGL